MLLGLRCGAPCKGDELSEFTPAVPAEALAPLVAGFKEVASRNFASQATL